MNTQTDHEPDDRPEAVQRAERGAQAWRAVVHAQQSVTPRHGDFYDLTGYLVDTLTSISTLARTLAEQVAPYADLQPDGQVVYDDTRTVDPAERLHEAVLDLRRLADSASYARWDANRFWSAISHIGVEDTPTVGQADGEVSR